MESKIQIYTDGAASGNPGPAGWGAVFIIDGKTFELGGGSDHATNNQMELTAAIEALKYVKQKNLKGEIEIFADSKYVIQGVNEWIHNWMKNGWRNAAKKPVMNQELWRELHTLNQDIKPAWHYVEGHASNEYNNRADEIAVSFYGEPVKLRQ